MPVFMGRKGWDFIGGRWKRVRDMNRPFGVMMRNGMNFAKSIHDPKSVLRRILWIVEMSDRDLTKREILRYAGYQLDVPDSDGRTYNVTRGFLCWYFSAFNKAGFLTPVRRGRTVVWVKGPNFPNLNLIVRV